MSVTYDSVTAYDSSVLYDDIDATLEPSGRMKVFGFGQTNPQVSYVERQNPQTSYVEVRNPQVSDVL